MGYYMSHIMVICLLLSLSSCEYLLSPPAIEIEKEVAIEALEFVEYELEQQEEKKP